MGKRLVVGLNRRGDGVPDTEIALFEGEGLADQFADILYREEWKYLAGDINNIRVDEVTLNRGFDRWSNDDRYSANPLFYKTTHELWNQVPPNIARVPGPEEVQYVVQVKDRGATKVIMA